MPFVRTYFLWFGRPGLIGPKAVFSEKVDNDYGNNEDRTKHLRRGSHGPWTEESKAKLSKTLLGNTYAMKHGLYSKRMLSPMRPTKGDGRWVAWMVGKLLTDYPDGEESIIILLAIDLFHCFRLGKESLQDGNGFRSKFQMQEYLRLESSVRQNFKLIGKKHKHKESLDDFMTRIKTEMETQDRARNPSGTTCTYHNIEEHDEQQQYKKELATQIADLNLEAKSAEELMDIAEDDSQQEDIRSRALAIAKDKIEEIDDTQE